MRVAFVFISMPVGGAEDFALSVSRYFPKGIEPVFVCLRSLGIIGEELGPKAALVRAAPGKRLNFPGILRLAKWLREQKIDLVHSQTYHAHLYAVAAARWLGIPAIVHQQKTLAKMPLHRSLFMRAATKMATHVLALSEKTKSDLETAFGLPENKVSVVPNAVDRAVFTPLADVQSARRVLGLPDGFVCGAIASLNQVKNHLATIRAYAALKGRGHAFTGVFLGEGAWRQELQQTIEAEGLSENVKLLGNKRPVAPWLQALDLLVLPSHWEGQPMILLQALSSQIPVLASRIEGNVAALGEKHPGLFDLQDEKRYAELMERVLLEPEFRKEILEYQSQLPIPDAEQVGAGLAVLYQQLCSKSEVA